MKAKELIDNYKIEEIQHMVMVDNKYPGDFGQSIYVEYFIYNKEAETLTQIINSGIYYKYIPTYHFHFDNCKDENKFDYYVCSSSEEANNIVDALRCLS